MAIKTLSGRVNVIKNVKTNRVKGVDYKGDSYFPRSTFIKSAKISKTKIRLAGRKTLFVKLR